jgi:hypothetical protein
MVRIQLLTVCGLIARSRAIRRIDAPPACISAARSFSEGA